MTDGITPAQLDDAMCMKLSAIAGRGAARDFWDLHEILVHRSLSLSAALESFRKKYATEDEGHIVKSLSYFADADGSPLPVGLDPEKWAAIKADFEARVRELA